MTPGLIVGTEVEKRAAQIWADMRAQLERVLVSVRRPDEPIDEGALVERAARGREARTFLESPSVQQFMAEAEAKLVTQILDAPLGAHKEVERLRVAAQSHRQMMRWLLALTQDGKLADAELNRLKSGRRAFF